jgi:hypothetical protein
MQYDGRDTIHHEQLNYNYRQILNKFIVRSACIVVQVTLDLLSMNSINVSCRPAAIIQIILFRILHVCFMALYDVDQRLAIRTVYLWSNGIVYVMICPLDLYTASAFNKRINIYRVAEGAIVLVEHGGRRVLYQICCIPG